MMVKARISLKYHFTTIYCNASARPIRHTRQCILDRWRIAYEDVMLHLCDQQQDCCAQWLHHCRSRLLQRCPLCGSQVDLVLLLTYLAGSSARTHRMVTLLTHTRCDIPVGAHHSISNLRKIVQTYPRIVSMQGLLLTSKCWDLKVSL